MFDYKIKVWPVKAANTKLVGIASVVVDGWFSVGGFRIVAGANGLFVGPPQSSGKNEEGEEAWYDNVRFFGEEGIENRKKMYDAILLEYYRSQDR